MIQRHGARLQPDKLLPRVQEAFRHEKTDAAIFREMGELGPCSAPPSRAVMAAPA